MKIDFLLAATAAVAMASCANDTDLSGSTPSALGDGSIAFNMNTPATTRSGLTGNDAVTKLNNMFIVWGEKNETGGKKAGDTDVVFKNYVVKHDKKGVADSTNSYGANSTTSNTNGWEYVGLTPYTAAQVSPSILTDGNSTTKQTIKYWDDQATDYTFTAISALQEDIKKGNVVITKNTGSTATDADNSTVYDKGYTVQVKKDASVDNIFYADRKNIAKGNDHKVVQMTFRNFMSKVRFGIYEIVPGYKVVITGIRYNTGTGDADKVVTNPTTTGEGESATTDNTFGIDGDFVTTGDNTKFKVTYENNSSKHENRAKVALEDNASKNTYLNTGGTTWLTTTGGIGTASNNPTWDNVTTTTTQGDGNSGGTTTSTVNWKTILPNPSNTTNLKLQIAYKLISEDTGEEIVFKGTDSKEIFRTVEVPAEYCQWKSNYAYSYIFKISDKSAELYPITFDAVVETEQTGNQETITTMDDDTSITTIGARTTDGKTTIVNGENEYTSGDTIYATVMEYNSTDKKYETVTLKNEDNDKNIALYTVISSDNFPITEASVANAISHAGGKITCTEVSATTTTDGSTTTNWELVKEVPAEDGSTVTLDKNNKKALKWTAADNTVYAIQYKKADKTYSYKIVKVAATTQQGS